eukprot:CFRG3387T1
MLALKQHIHNLDSSEVNTRRLVAAHINPELYVQRRRQLFEDLMCSNCSSKQDVQSNQAIEVARREYVVLRNALLNKKYCHKLNEGVTDGSLGQEDVEVVGAATSLVNYNTAGSSSMYEVKNDENAMLREILLSRKSGQKVDDARSTSNVADNRIIKCLSSTSTNISKKSPTSVEKYEEKVNEVVKPIPKKQQVRLTSSTSTHSLLSSSHVGPVSNVLKKCSEISALRNDTSVDTLSMNGEVTNEGLNRKSLVRSKAFDRFHRRTQSDLAGSGNFNQQTMRRNTGISSLRSGSGGNRSASYVMTRAISEYYRFSHGNAKPLCIIKQHKSPISCVAFSPKPIARPEVSLPKVASRSSTAYSPRDSNIVNENTYQNPPTKVSHTLAIASMDGKISVIRVQSQISSFELLHTLEGHAQGICDMSWLVTGQLLVSVSLDGTFRVWQTDTGSTLMSVKVGEPILACALCPINNNLLVIGTAMGSVRTYNCSLGKAIKKGKMGASQGVNGDVRCLCFNDNGTVVWSGSSNGVVHAFGFDPSNGSMTALTRVIIASKTAITAMSFCPDWTLRPNTPSAPMLLLSVCNNQVVLLHVVDEKSGLVKQRRALPVVHTSALVKASSCFCAQSSNGSLQSAEAMSTMSPNANEPGACVVSGSEDGKVYIFDTTTKNVISTLGRESSCAVLAVTWNQDQSILASGDAGGVVKLWHRTGSSSANAM